MIIPTTADPLLADLMKYYLVNGTAFIMRRKL
jgi:hypothetical protein